MRTRLMSGARLWPHLYEGVDRKNREVGLALGVVDQVEVHELLQLDVPRLDAVEHVGEQHRDVLTHGHRGDDLLDRLLLLLHLGVGQLLLELADLACRAASQVRRASRCARFLTAAELWRAAGGAPFFVVWKYLLSFPAALLPPKLGSLVFILSTWQRRGGRVQKCATP